MHLHPAHRILQPPTRGHNARERAPQPSTPPPIPRPWPPVSKPITGEELNQVLRHRHTDTEDSHG